MQRQHGKIAVTTILVIGLALVAAPFAFGMFERAPKGGDMIEDFRPFMTAERVQLFRGYISELGAANAEAASLRESIAAAPDTTSTDTASIGAVADLNDRWNSIDTDMSDLIDRMDDNLGNFRAVAALPPFPLFPWFFAIPGVLIAVLAGSVLFAARRSTSSVRRRWALAGFGVSLILAPAVFQMFTRAPQGGEMIDDFRPMMTHTRVQAVQSYFITLGAAEGQLRTKAIPLAARTGSVAADYPAIQRMSMDWPKIVVDFNPMIATMADNLDNYEAVDALPSFPLFPWFFVIPGALVGALGFIATRQSNQF